MGLESFCRSLQFWRDGEERNLANELDEIQGEYGQVRRRVRCQRRQLRYGNRTLNLEKEEVQLSKELQNLHEARAKVSVEPHEATS